MKIVIENIQSKKEAEKIAEFLIAAGYGAKIVNDEWDDENDDWNPEA